MALFFAGSSISMQPSNTLGRGKVCGLKLGSFMIKGRSSLSFTMRPMPTRLQICCAAMNFENRVREVIIEQLGVRSEDVVAQASLVDDLEADSLDTVEIVMALAEEFEIEIPLEEAEKIITVQDAVDYIEKATS